MGTQAQRNPGITQSPAVDSHGLVEPQQRESCFNFCVRWLMSQARVAVDGTPAPLVCQTFCPVSAGPGGFPELVMSLGESSAAYCGPSNSSCF